MATYEIPLTPEAQNLSVSLAGKSYQLRLIWNQLSLLWILDIADAAGNAIINGIPLVANTDLLEPYGYLGFGGKLVAQTDGKPDISPTYDNLGVLGRLYFVTI